MRRLRALSALTAILLLAAACSGDDPDEPAATATSAPFPTPEATPTVLPLPTQPPIAPTPLPGVQRVPSSVWLIDSATGQKTTIFEDFDAAVHDAAFAHGNIREVHVVYRPDVVSLDVLRTRVSFDGRDLSTEPEDEVCHQTQGGIEVRGRHYDALYCGPTSDDGRWLLFERVVRQVPHVPGSNYLVPETEMWVLDLRSGVERKIQDGLIGCGGCDGRFGPAFSASGRFAYFAETGPRGRVWLADLEAGTTRQISEGPAANQQGNQPDFSPIDDTIVYLDPSQQTIVENLVTGRSLQLASPGWPGQFDPSGHLVYTVEGNPRESQVTHIFETTTGTELTALGGAPADAPYWLSDEPHKVVMDDGGFVATLENVPGCAGTGVYPRTNLEICINAVGASISPDGRQISLARATGYTGHVQYPGGGSVALVFYDIVLYDLTAGSERVVASGAISSEVPPVMTWNDASTHFLVRWPLHPGL